MSTIKVIRKRLGLTQSELGSAIGCTQGNIGHYEKGGHAMPPHAAKRLIAYAATKGIALSYDEIYGQSSDSTLVVPVHAQTAGA